MSFVLTLTARADSQSFRDADTPVAEIGGSVRAGTRSSSRNSDIESVSRVLVNSSSYGPLRRLKDVGSTFIVFAALEAARWDR
jgi:hypothetical protein